MDKSVSPDPAAQPLQRGAFGRSQAADPTAAIDPTAIVDALAHVDVSVRIGAHCIVEAGVHISPGVALGQRVHVAANATFAAGDVGTAGCAVRDDVAIGANATLLAGIVVHAGAVVRPGAVVTRSVPPLAIVEGNPAVITGYVDTMQGPDTAAQAAAGPRKRIEATGVRNVTVHKFPVVTDLRGSLTVGEFDKEIPFKPLRYFMVFDVPSKEVRGEHAHHACHQFLICVRGACAVVADDGKRRVEVALSASDIGIYLPPLTWGVQYKYSADALLLVFASHAYDPDDYIRSYDSFVHAVAGLD